MMASKDKGEEPEGKFLDLALEETEKESRGERLSRLLTSRCWIIPLIVFVTAFLIRLLYIIQLGHAPYVDVPLVDEETYYRTARDLIEGRGYGARPFWQPPLYPAFLALLLAVGKGSLFAVRFFQAVLGSLSCILIYLVGRSLFDRKTAFLASLIAACYGVLIYFDGTLLSPSLLIFLALLSFLTGLKAVKKNRPVFWGLSGFFLGLAGITWASVLLFAPVLLVWAFFSRVDVEITVQAMKRPAAVAIGLLIAILPVTFYNGFKGGDWVLISTNGGINFYLGNNENADETVSIRPGYPWKRLVDLPWHEAKTELASEDSSFFYRKGLSFITGKPHLFAGRLFVKFYRFWNSGEISRNVYIYDTTRYAWILRILLWPTGTFCFPFGLLSPLAILGFILAWRDRGSLYPAYGFIGMICLAVILFFVTSRYRAPVLPFLCLFASYAVLKLIEFWRAERIGDSRLGAGILIGLLILCNLPVLRPREPEAAEIPYLAALTLYDRGEEERAAMFCQQALDENASFYPALMRLGLIAYNRGHYEEAHSYLKRALDIAPDSPEANNQFGIVLSTMGFHDAALISFRKAAAFDPLSETFHLNLARCLIVLGHLDDAIDMLRRTAALAMDEQQSYPKIVDAVNRVAESMIADGFDQRALVLLDWARELLPGDVRTLRNLIFAHMRLGDDPRIFKNDMNAFIRLAPQDVMVPDLQKILAYLGETAP